MPLPCIESQWSLWDLNFRVILWPCHSTLKGTEDLHTTGTCWCSLRQPSSQSQKVEANHMSLMTCLLQHGQTLKIQAERGPDQMAMLHDPTHSWAHCFACYLYIVSLVYVLSSWWIYRHFGEGKWILLHWNPSPHHPWGHKIAYTLDCP